MAFPTAKVNRRLDLEHDDLEALFVELILPHSTVLVCCAYCPPSLKDEAYKHLDSSLSLALSKQYANVLVFGDFNAHIDWTSHDDPLPHDRSDDLLLDVMTSANLVQACLEPTYSSRDGTSSSLDLVFVADPTRITSCTTSEGLSNSDHRAIEVYYAAVLPRNGYHARQLWKFDQTDHTHLARLAHLAPWCMTSSGDDCIAIHVEHQRYTTKVAEKATENPKVFWSYVNSLRSSRHRPSFNIQGKLVDNPAEVSALFAEQFSSIYDQAPADDSELLEKFSPRDQSAHPTQLPDDSRDDSLLLSATFSPEALSSAISKINPSPSPGPDGMAPTFFRLLAPQVLVSLCTVFQSLLDHGTVPASWKRALVTPVHKGKSKPSNDPENYRPISITPIICRTFERVLNSQLLDFLERTKFFPASQHGFRRDRSCDTALATLNQIVSHNLDNRTETDLIQLDLSNAFDTLNISLLLDKAKESGIRGCLLRWLANFLTGRSQRYDTSILAPILSPTTTQDLQAYLTVIDSWIVSNHLRLSPR
ncbi:hypothetical protein MTO96_015139 [Rhipicephalus appendiculatus]